MVLVILAIITLIAIPLVMNIIRKANTVVQKRSVDAYGRSVELAIASYLLDTGAFPTNEQLPSLKIEYGGKKVECNVMNIRKDGGLYLSQCKVNNIEVKDSKEEDGYYHYGKRDLTNKENIDMYVAAVEDAIDAYHDKNNTYPESIDDLNIDYIGESVNCNLTINPDGSLFIDGCNISGINVDYKKGNDKSTAVKALLSNTNDISVTRYTDGNIHEMYTFSHPKTLQTSALTDYRYIGGSPYNYVKFNNELWRIIGVFDVEDSDGSIEQKIKIVRNEKLDSNMPWDSSNKNEWSTASLNKYLNETYFNTFDNFAKSAVSSSKYYLGGRSWDNGALYGTTEDMYNWERDTIVYSGRSTSWIGKIALMYPSDYMYIYALEVSNICFEDGNMCKTNSGGAPTQGWIYNIKNLSNLWLLSPHSQNESRVIFVGGAGELYNGRNDNSASKSYSVLPTLYLEPQIKITSGTGKSDDPYELSL